MTLGLTLALIFFALALLAVGGLFAANDGALSASSRAALFRMAEGGRRTDQMIRKIADDEPAHQNAISFARVIAESLAAVIITIVLDAYIENFWLTLLAAGGVLTLTTFVLLGASPRSTGAAHPEPMIRFSAPLLRVTRIVLGPIAAGLTRVSTRGQEPYPDDAEVETDDERLLSLVDRAAERNLLEEEDRAYIHSLVEFGDRLVRELMVPRTDMRTIEANTTIRDALDEVLASRHSRLPVVAEDDGDDIQGVIYLRDTSGFVFRHESEASTQTVHRIMKPAQFVPDLMRADDLLQQMQRDSNHLAVTVDEYGGISGLITMEDLIEELIGEIHDEHDREVPDIEDSESGSYSIAPRLPVEELGEIFDIELEDEDVDTAAGLLVKELGRLAVTGDTVVVAGIELTVTSADRRHTIHRLAAKWVGNGDAASDDDHGSED